MGFEKGFRYTVFWSDKDPSESDANETRFSTLSTAEAFAAAKGFATVWDDFTDEAVSYWQSGVEV